MSVFMFLTRSKIYYNETTWQFPSCGNKYLKMLPRKEKICMICCILILSRPTTK